MEQRNEMLKHMRLTNRQKKGDVQHMLARSFSRKAIPVPTTPLSPPGEISIPVPQFPVAQSPFYQQTSIDGVSVGELSIEPRVAGSGTALTDMATLSPTQSPHSQPPRTHSPTPLMELTTPTPPPPTMTVTSSSTLDTLSPDKMLSLEFEEEEVDTSNVLEAQSPPRGTPPRGDSFYRRTRKDSSSSSGSSCPEDQAVRTPLLEGPEITTAPSTLPTNPQPSIKRYDDMFRAADEYDSGARGADTDKTSQP